MTSRPSFVFTVGLLLATTVVVGLLTRELSRSWFLPGLMPDLLGELQQSLADQRELARLSPETAAERHRRFDRTQGLVRRLRVLSWSRDDLAGRHASLLLLGAVTVAAAAGGAHWWRQSRRDRRLVRLHSALRGLAEGTPDVRVDDRGRDVIGRIARMVEEVSAVHARDRRRLASLDDLARWQEAARRHAHEMRTPLAAAELDLARLREAGEALDGPALREAIAARVGELDGDLRRLAEFARAFADFGRLPEPRLVPCDLLAFAREFVERFTRAWPGLDLQAAGAPEPCRAAVDPDLLRQVLVNLCENSARAAGEAGQTRVRVAIRVAGEPDGVGFEVTDDGPGVPPEARARLFQPYASFRRGGTGLGLAISRKILLDHGGDLDLLPSPHGAAFRLRLPRLAAEPGA